ncbi:MAG: hypothetical protein HY774_03980 [Acidobacteria bacterium]|nr:hypothetical protein [Acidobacteriota bacterium]
MKKPLLVVFLVVFSWTISASAYTVILKDGRRLEVQENYRIVNDIAVFVLADGKRFSVSVNNVDIAKTEMANHQGIGEFVQRASAPLPILDSDVQTAKKETPVLKDKAAVARAKSPITRTLVNADFEAYKQRRGDSGKDKEGKSEPAEPVEVAAAVPAYSPPPVDPVLDRKSEAYWRERARPLLTEMAVQEELIGILQNQLSQLEANRGRQTTYGAIQTPGGVVINGNGGYYNPGSTILIPQNNTNGQDFETKVRERLMEARLNLTAVQIRYNALTEEARRAGVPPGWTRWQ